MKSNHLTVSAALFLTVAGAHAVEFGNVDVIQNDAGNSSSSITLQRTPGSSSAFTILGGNRGDYEVSFGSPNDAAAGVMIASVAENGRDNTAGGEEGGLFYATCAASDTSSGTYNIALFRSAVGDECNVNVGCAWFPFDEWLGGYVKNSTGANGGPLDALTGSAGIAIGTHFTDESGGKSLLDLTALGAGSADGVLLVNHAKNEDNFALSKANSDGSFSLYVHDNGSNGRSYEQDPVAFVYIPVNAVGTKQLVAAARVNNDASTDVAGGSFSLVKAGTGQWFLTIPGQTNTSGVLIISPEGDVTNNVDNVISYEWDPAGSHWVIESRDLSGNTNQPNLQNGATDDEDMFSFAFFETDNEIPTAEITAPAGDSFTSPGTFTIEANASDSDGTVTKVEFLRNGVVVGTDTTAPFSYTESNLLGGSYDYIARATDNEGSTGVSQAKNIRITLDPENIPANTALSFDGIDDYVTMGSAPELNVGGPPASGLTLECWFRKDGAGLTASSGSGGVRAVPLFGKGRGESDGSNVDCNILFGINSAGILVADFESYSSGLNHPITAVNQPIENGTWNHAAVTFDGVTGVWTMYLNGVEVGTQTVSVGGAVPRFDSIQHFGIGSALNSSGVAEGAFAGIIDEARVWDHARSATEIAASMDTEIGSGTGLLGRFGLNEGTGLRTESSSGATIGNLVNGPMWVNGAPFAIQNQAPVVSVSAPAESVIPSPVSFTATASDADGSVKKVEFLINGEKVGEDTTAPYAFDWTPSGVGTFSVRAIARDNLGAAGYSTSSSLEILPNPNQAPVVENGGPADGSEVSGRSVMLSANLADPEGDAMTVTFYGRQTTPVEPGEDFSLVAIPDTQYYSQGSASRANNVTVEELVGTFGAQTQWIAENKTARNIAFVSHMGDVVESGNFGGNTIQWDRATAAMGKLEKPLDVLRAYGIPFGVAPGNHDIDPIGSYDSGSTAFFNQFFGTDRFEGRDYWGGSYGSDNTNNYQLWSASGLDFISIHLAYDTTPNQAILDWADALLKAHPHRRAIITCHYIIGRGNPASFSTQGAAIYENLKDNPNLFLMLCGHIHAEGFRSDTFEGRTVYSVLSDYQGLQDGGRGFLRTFTFSPANNRIRVESYSPTLDREVLASDNLPHFDGSYDLSYDMQAPVMDWVPIGTMEVGAGGTTSSVQWTGLEQGRHYEWYAAATDGINVISSAPSKFTTAEGIAPVVTLDAPVDAATFSSPAIVELKASASDSDGVVDRVEFYNGGMKIGEDRTAPYEFSWTQVPAGSYELSAVAVDDDGLTGLSSGAAIVVNLGDIPPLVRITSPAVGSVLEVPASLTLAADATDHEAEVVKVGFYSGALEPVLLAEDDTAPFTVDLSNLGAGSYHFTARATDSVGQTTVSEPVVVQVFTEALPPQTAQISVGNFDLPTWTIVKTSPSPNQFDQAGSDIGDLEIRINGTSVNFSEGIALANNWSGPASANNSSHDNIVQPYADGVGNLFINVLDNSNDNAAGANPATAEQTSGVSVAWLPFSQGWTGAIVNTTGEVISGNLPEGVTVVKSGGSGIYAVNGLSVAGNMLAYTNGNTGTLAENVCSVRVENNQWIIDTRDNGDFSQSNEFSFVYLPPHTGGVFAGAISGDGVVSNLNALATEIGVMAIANTEGLDVTFGDGSLINPGTAALFVTADSTDGGYNSPAVNNLICVDPVGDSFRIYSQDLPEINGTHEAIDVRFMVIPFAPVVSIVATDASAGEFGEDKALEFKVSRMGATTAELAVPLVSAGSATEGRDYSGFTSPLTIPADQTSSVLPLTVIPDDKAEGMESVDVSLGNSVEFATGSAPGARASIADHPAQDYYFTNIADPSLRAPTADADGDSNANAVEYFMGSLPGDASSNGYLEVPESSGTTFKIRYPRALDRSGVTGRLSWSSDLETWHADGESNGTHTVTFVEEVVSESGANPETVEATATITGDGTAPKIFVRLGVE
ncbi:Ig-like domain-containing protein [Luteolibacter algae]|uniref:Ig-like domain-containing protein n=1 Tax=Luteolibacter algae TaxID=454151 RepID=A0ABW5D5H9_9BACT